MKKTVKVFDYAGVICEAMKKGILLTTAYNGKVNTMTIGWGTIGIEWGRPVFVAYVRETRFTRQLLDDSGEFTVNIPVGPPDTGILSFCGTKSGRDHEKITELGLTLEPGDAVGVPGIREFPLTLECKILSKQKQELSTIPQDIQNRYYLTDANGWQDYHYAYYGQILNAYLIEE